MLRLFLRFSRLTNRPLFDSNVWKERKDIRRMYNIKGTSSNDFWVSCCCLGEAVIQHRNEIMIRQAKQSIPLNQDMGYVAQPGMYIPPHN